MEQKEEGKILFKIDKYIVEWLNKRNIIIRDTTRSETDNIIGYYPRLSQALQDFLETISVERHLADRTISVIRCINDAKLEIVEAVNNIDLDALTAS